tara:strand:+ start:1483 stop:2124 length:642 start_codon:yes stop_codon:yes gene_type:complete
MAKTLEATYDPSEASKWMPIEEGEYPAHITSLRSKEITTRAGEAIVVNMEYKVAEEVSSTTQKVWKMEGYKYQKDTDGNKIPVTNGDGEQKIANCSHLKDKIFQDNGYFIFTESTSSSKNGRYFELLDKLGVDCGEVKADGKKVKKLVLLEDDDVVGKPVLITVKRHEFVTSETKHLPPDQQERRSTFKVNNVTPWKGGQQLAAAELESDVPF